jgi:truncated hemoglobin YjbI
MADSRPSRNLALEIGMYHIALVVNAVLDQMKTQPALATLFDVNGSHSGEKACLTYFWWLVLGGNKLSDLDSDVIRRCGRMGISPSLSREWLALFRQTAPPING